MNNEDRQYIAHVREENGDWKIHSVKEHLIATATRAAEFSATFGARQMGYLAGLWHDLGKYKLEFQKRIRNQSGYDSEAHMENVTRVQHAISGAIYLSQQYPQPIDPPLLLGHLLAFPIIAHHGGLRNFQETILPLLNGSPEEQSALQVLLDSVPEEIRSIRDFQTLIPTRRPTSKALFIKMLYSCLVDADFLDTEEFMDPERRQMIRTNPSSSIATLNERLGAYLAEIMDKSEKTPVNAQRQRLLTEVQGKAGLKPGFFSLTVPTGGGKTLTSLSFALRHALSHNKNRIVYAIPYTSIIEQTADVFREAVGEVLEHHSSIDPEKETSENRLLAENWDAPLIVTTNVQLFESLFHRKSSRNRKLHNLVNSVIILDEAQMLPPDYLTPILYVLKTLVSDYGATVVFCTATQPAFQSQQSMNFSFKGIDSIVELVDDVPDLFRNFKRVNVELPESFGYPKKKDSDFENRFWKDLAGKLALHDRVLCIVNTKKDALQLHENMPEGSMHLSGNMCAEHRTAVIQEIKVKLKERKSIRVVSTQLVEAGVDIDFPVVYRAMAGLDSIAQSAGRCNREGKMGEPGRVVVFIPPRRPPAGHLRQSEEVARAVLEDHGNENVLSPDTYRKYYQNLLWTKGESLDKKKILPAMQLLNFETVHKEFKMIEEAGKTIVVPYGNAKTLVKKLEKPMHLFQLRKLQRSLQRYTVNIPEKIYDLLLKEDSIRMYYATIPVLMEADYYNSVTGFDAGSFGKFSPEELII